MGPLWAWVILWLISAYGLVLLLRRSMAWMPVETVPVLVATPTPVEPASAETPEQTELPGEADAEEKPVEEIQDLDPQAPADTGEPLPPMPPLEEPEAIVSTLEPADSPVEATLDEDPKEEISSEPWVKEKEGLEPREPWVKEKEGLDPSEPWAKEKEGLDPSEPWVKEKEGLEPSEPWVKEKEALEASEPWVKEKELLEADLSQGQEGDDEVIPEADGPDPSGEADDVEPVEYRSIALDSLTLGLQATEIQERYGSPGHMSKVGEDGEQWRYPLNAPDDRGGEVEGVLVLEFQRGRLVSKAFEQAEVDPAHKDA